jgi:hypothetical protein
MTDIKQAAYEICDYLSEAKALIDDHVDRGKLTAPELVKKLDVLFEDEGLLRAMYRVGFFDFTPSVVPKSASLPQVDIACVNSEIGDLPLKSKREIV